MFKLRYKRHYRNLATYSWCTTWREQVTKTAPARRRHSVGAAGRRSDTTGGGGVSKITAAHGSDFYWVYVDCICYTTCEMEKNSHSCKFKINRKRYRNLERIQMYPNDNLSKFRDTNFHDSEPKESTDCPFAFILSINISVCWTQHINDMYDLPAFLEPDGYILDKNCDSTNNWLF